MNQAWRDEEDLAVGEDEGRLGVVRAPSGSDEGDRFPRAWGGD